MAAAGAALRLRLLYRMLRIEELLALAVVLSWSTSRASSAAAAVLRLRGSLLLNPRFVFVLGNTIVLLLLALSKRDPSLSSSTNHLAVIALFPTAPAAVSFASFTTPAPPPVAATAEAQAVVVPVVVPVAVAPMAPMFKEGNPAVGFSRCGEEREAVDMRGVKGPLVFLAPACVACWMCYSTVVLLILRMRIRLRQPLEIA